MGFLQDLFGGGAEKEAAERNRALVGQNLLAGNAYLDRGVSQASGYLDQARGAYDPLAALAGNYRQGSDLYLNALGVNGADAARTAQQSFTTGPGYQQGIDAGLNAINRRRAAGGMLDSGNADLDALTFAQNAQNKEYGGWLDRLGGINQQAQSATGQTAAGQAGVYGSLADLYNQDSQNRVNLHNSYTSGNMSANNQEAAGRSAGARNLLGAGMSLANLAAGGFGGGGFGFGGGGSSVGGYDVSRTGGVHPFFGN